jgi:hypothetical protein
LSRRRSRNHRRQALEQATNAPTAAELEAAAVARLLETRLAVLAAIEDLKLDHQFVVALFDSSQTVVRGFASSSRMAARDTAARREREQAVARRAAMPLGLTWTISADKSGLTEGEAAGNLAALSVDAEIWATFSHQLRRSVTDLKTKGVSSIIRIPREPDVDDLAGALADYVDGLTNLADQKLLDEIARDIAAAQTLVTNLLDGDDRARLDKPCPHCGRKTLVVYLRKDLIQCDRNPRTGHYEACRCGELLCECRQRPYSFRHTWRRTDTGNTSWTRLAARIESATAKKTAHQEDTDD